MSTYRILLPLRKGDPLADLVTLAAHLLPEEGGQIELMGVVMVPRGALSVKQLFRHRRSEKR